MTQLATLFKTSALSGIENVVKLLLGLAIIKMIAFSYGPEGMALFGQFQNMYTATIAFSSGMLVTGGVRYSAQYQDDAEKLNHFFNESLFFSFCVTGILSLCFLFFAEGLSEFIFGTPGFSSVFKLFSVSLFFITLNIFGLSLLNGLGLIKPFIASKILLSLCLLVTSVATIYYFQIKTFFDVYIAVNAAGFLFFMRYLKRYIFYDAQHFFGVGKAIWRSRLFSFWLMAVAGILTTPLVLSVIRRIIVNELGIVFAGYWDAITRFTELYLVIITGAMLTYYIPRLGRYHTAKETKQLVFMICLFAAGVSFPITLFIYFFRYELVRVVLDASFMVTTEYFGIALIASVVKIVSWVFSYYLIAKSKVVAFLFSELLFGALLIVQVYFMTPLFGLHGVFYASLINAVAFLLCVYFIFVKEMRTMERINDTHGI